MAFKQRHRAGKMATSNTMIGRNCNSDKQKCKYSSKILTETWLPPQNTKRWDFEFQTRDICTPLRGPQYSKNEGSNQVITGTRPVAFQE